MTSYDLKHLTQDSIQNIGGPIQDDEALFLYALIRICRLKKILEIGGLLGYSATNFLKALEHTENGTLYTCDIKKIKKLADNHKILHKDAREIVCSDIDNEKLDMIFFDAHVLAQIEVHDHLLESKLIDDDTFLVLHDTNLHYYPFQHCGLYIKELDGYAHQPVEREMVNIFKARGYDILNLHTNKSKHNKNFPVRHGITICKKFKTLINSPIPLDK